MEYIPRAEGEARDEARSPLTVSNSPVDKLSPGEAIFCQWYAEERRLVLAFQQAFPSRVSENRHTTWQRARDVFLRPHVQARIIELQDAVAQRVVAHLAAIAQDLHDIAEADPNDLVRLERYNCRHCHGVDFKWQWVDALELARSVDQYRYAVQDYADKKADGAKGKELGKPPRPPSDGSGGYGFVLKGEPHPACPACYGQGYARTHIADTTKLDPRTRKLYKGLKEKADGSIEILMHDQQQARDMLIKMMGGYKDGKIGDRPQGGAELIPTTATAEEAQRAYMRLIAG